MSYFIILFLLFVPFLLFRLSLVPFSGHETVALNLFKRRTMNYGHQERPVNRTHAGTTHLVFQEECA